MRLDWWWWKRKVFLFMTSVVGRCTAAVLWRRGVHMDHSQLHAWSGSPPCVSSAAGTVHVLLPRWAGCSSLQGTVPAAIVRPGPVSHSREPGCTLHVPPRRGCCSLQGTIPAIARPGPVPNSHLPGCATVRRDSVQGTCRWDTLQAFGMPLALLPYIAENKTLVDVSGNGIWCYICNIVIERHTDLHLWKWSIFSSRLASSLHSSFSSTPFTLSNSHSCSCSLPMFFWSLLCLTASSSPQSIRAKPWYKY